MNSRLIYSLDYSHSPFNEYRAGDNPADALHKAAEIGDLIQMEEILARDPGALNRFHSVHGTTPLCWATENDSDSSALDFLISHRANPLLAPKTAYFYYPAAFLINLSREYQPRLHKNLLKYIQQRVIQLFSQTALLSTDDLISLYHNVLLLIGNDAVTSELLTNLSELKQQIMQRPMTQDKRAVISLSLMLAEVANLPSELSLLDNDSCIKVIDAFPAHIKDDELSCELFTYANQVMESEDECFDLTSYYDLALQLMNSPSDAFRAAIHLKKSIFHANMLFWSDSDNDAASNEIESDTDDEKSLEEEIENPVKFDIEKAIDILKNLTFTNDTLSLLLRVTVTQVFPATKIFDIDLLLELLSLSRQFEIERFALQEIQIMAEVLMAKKAIHVNDHSQVIIHLNSILQYHMNLAEIDRPLEACHVSILEAILEFLGRRLIEILASLVVDETRQIHFIQVLNNFLLCVKIIDYYDLASRPILNSLDHKSVGFETLFHFKDTILTNPQTLPLYYPKLDQFLSSLLQCTIKYTLTINLIQAAFEIFKTKDMNHFPRYEVCLIEALRTSNYSIYLKGLEEIASMLSSEHNGSLTSLVNSLAEHFEKFRVHTEPLFVELIFNNFMVARDTQPWLANIYYYSIECVIAEKAAHARISTNSENHLNRQQAETLCRRMDDILVPQGHPSLFNRFCLFTHADEENLLRPEHSSTAMRLA